MCIVHYENVKLLHRNLGGGLCVAVTSTTKISFLFGKHYLLMVMYESNALEVKLVKLAFKVQMSANGKNIFNGKKMFVK